MADKQYKITFDLSDGTEKSVEFTAPQGEPGNDGSDYVLTDADKSDIVKMATDGLLFKTVADMEASDNLSPGWLVETCGYYSERDGGSCVYEVVAEKTASYDIEGNGVAFRPVVSGVAYPKMFGTYNDGVTADNVPLQACFDYVADYGIATIDGAGLTYYVNHSTDAITLPDQSHIYPNGLTNHGVIIRTGVELKNYNSVLMPYTEINTPVLVLIQSQNNTYHIHDCKFDGNYGNHEERPSGTGTDGGRHLLFFTYEDTMFPDDFRECGDITIERCKLHNPDSYPIMIAACDCTYTVRECDIKSHAMGILTYATNCIVRDCTFATADHYKAMVHNFCHDEIEFGSNYTGSKKKNIEITNCRVSAVALYKVDQNTQVGVNYGTVKIIDCVNEYENGDIYVDYLDLSAYNSPKTIDNIEIRGCVTPSVSTGGTQKNVHVTGANVGQVIIDDTLLTSCGFVNSNVCKIIFKNLKNDWAFTMGNSDGYILEEVIFDNIMFNSVDLPIIEQASGVKSIKAKNCTSKNRLQIVGASSKAAALSILIDNFIYEELDVNACTFIDIGGTGEYGIVIKDSQFLTAFGNYALINVESGSTATGKILMQNVVAVDVPITNGNLELIKKNVLLIDTDSSYVLTDVDKSDIADIVKEEVPLVKTAEQPTFVNSNDEMIDTSKIYVMPDMSMWAYLKAEPYTLKASDFIASSVDGNGVPYDPPGDVTNRFVTRDVWSLSKRISVSCPSPYQYIVYYYTGTTGDTYIGKTSFKSGDIADVSADVVASGISNGAKYCRISLRNGNNAAANIEDGGDKIMANVTVKQGDPNCKEWANTGHNYNQPADYEDRITALEKALGLVP